MLNRRMFLGASAATALVAPFAGFNVARAADAGAPLFRFGVIADPQYAPVPPHGTRYYSNTLWKLTEAVKDFNEQDLEFVITLGDIIDRRWESYSHILPIYNDLKAPYYFVLGNHDFAVAGEYLNSVLHEANLKRAYYDFEGGNYRFIVLDGNDISTYANADGTENNTIATERLAKLTAAGAPNAQSWNGTLSEAQFAWLKDTLDDAKAKGQRVIAQCHFPAYPKNQHNLWDDDRLVQLLTGYDNFVAYLNGHNHMGNYGQVGKAHFFNFRGMVETADTTAYSIVEVYEDRIEIVGRGVQESKTLTL